MALCLFPLVIRLSKKHGKKVMLLIANFVFTAVYCLIYMGDKIVAMFPGKELLVGLAMGVVVAFPFGRHQHSAAILRFRHHPQDSIQNGINREGMFSAVKTFAEKIASAVAMMCVSSILAVGAAQNEVVGLTGVKLTGIIAMIFSVISIIFYFKYNERNVLRTIEQQGGQQP